VRHRRRMKGGRYGSGPTSLVLSLRPLANVGIEAARVRRPSADDQEHFELLLV